MRSASSVVTSRGLLLSRRCTVIPASTIRGSLVFDVPAGDYYLRITDGGDLENERTALIEIPMTLDAPGALESTPAPIPGLQ